jgi:isopenicillin-N epimerase
LKIIAGVPTPDDESTWLARRREVMLDDRVTQLNAGTCSPTPRPVFDRAAALRRRQAESPTEFQWRDAWPLLRASRVALGGYLNADPSDLALVENVTVAINIAARSLQLPAGAEVVTTDHEYGSMLKLWDRLAAQHGWRLRVAALPARIDDPRQIVDAVRALVNDRTRVLFFSHVSSPSGLVLPARELCALARSAGAVSVIDGAHAPGNLDLDLAALDADVYCANCHKWLMAPASVGFLHANRRVKSTLRSAVSSWGHGYAADAIDEDVYPGTTNWHYDMEFHGTTDRSPQMSLPETLAFRESIGGNAAVRARVRALTVHLRERMKSLGLAAWLPHDERLVSTMTAFPLPAAYQSGGGGFIAAPSDSPAQRLQKRLWERYRIEVPATTCAGRVFLRVSTAWFNTRDEIDRFADALRAEM